MKGIAHAVQATAAWFAASVSWLSESDVCVSIKPNALPCDLGTDADKQSQAIRISLYREWFLTLDKSRFSTNKPSSKSPVYPQTLDFNDCGQEFA
jgi:hypothetical protein